MQKKMNEKKLNSFIDLVLMRGEELYRDFSWRKTSEPYEILLSEIMLQQTQVARVERYFERWLEVFPSVDALAAASTADVLEEWQGLGYNRRALMLKRLADKVSLEMGGVFPLTEKELVELPGVGPATAAGVMAFAYDKRADYLETNVRTVFLHEFWPKEEGVHDREIKEVLRAVNDMVEKRGVSARVWNYALLDYGVWLKKEFPNPSRRSKHHTRQSKFEGSNRQKRAQLLREILANPGATKRELAKAQEIEPDVAHDVLEQLIAEGFVVCDENGCFEVSD